MLIYRLENPATGVGPYQDYENAKADKIRNKIHTAHGVGNPNTPSPVRDNLDNVFDCYEMLCGCVNRKTLEQWFIGFWDELIKCGYSVARYTVSSNKAYIGKSGKQVVFYPSTKKIYLKP